MKNILILTLLLTTSIALGQKTTSETKEKNLPIMTTIEEAKKHVEETFNSKEELLLIADSLNDATGLNMAIIGVSILKKGYMPDGFEQKKGYRIYKYLKE